MFRGIVRVESEGASRRCTMGLEAQVMSVSTVLVVDDEPRIVDTLRLYLEREGFRVVTAFDGRSALEAAERHKPDLIILDLMLPEVSGWDVTRELRSRSAVPIIMLTARSEETDRVVGLELGADDYVTKPFSPREVVARVRAVLRRSSPVEPAAQAVHLGDLVLDVERHEVACSGKPVDLTPVEFQILATMARQPGRVFTRAQLIEAVQGYEYDGYDRAVDSHIKNLRKKLPEGCAEGIRTVRGIGYKLEAPQ